MRRNSKLNGYSTTTVSFSTAISDYANGQKIANALSARGAKRTKTVTEHCWIVESINWRCTVTVTRPAVKGRWENGPHLAALGPRAPSSVIAKFHYTDPTGPDHPMQRDLHDQPLNSIQTSDNPKCLDVALREPSWIMYHLHIGLTTL